MERTLYHSENDMMTPDSAKQRNMANTHANSATSSGEGGTKVTRTKSGRGNTAMAPSREGAAANSKATEKPKAPLQPPQLPQSSGEESEAANSSESESGKKKPSKGGPTVPQKRSLSRSLSPTQVDQDGDLVMGSEKITDWSEEVESAEAKQARKAARKEAKRQKRMEKKAEMQQAAADAQDRGELPKTACYKCKQMGHWSKDCLEPPPEPLAATQTTPAPTTGEATMQPPAKPTSDGKSKSAIRREKKAARNGLDDLTEKMARAGTAASSTESSRRTSITSSGGKSVTQDTRREAKGIKISNSPYTDGTWLYFKYPTELRPQERRPPLRVLVDAIGNLNGLNSGDVVKVLNHDSKGCVVQFKTHSIAEKSVQKIFKIDQHQITLVRFKTEGPNSFICFNTGSVSNAAIAHQIAGKLENAHFWLGREEYRGTQGNKMILLFARPPGFYRLELGFEDGAKKNNFKIRFVAPDLTSSNCQICGGAGHLMDGCPDIYPARVGETVEGLLEKKPIGF